MKHRLAITQPSLLAKVYSHLTFLALPGHGTSVGHRLCSWCTVRSLPPGSWAAEASVCSRLGGLPLLSWVPQGHHKALLPGWFDFQCFLSYSQLLPALQHIWNYMILNYLMLIQYHIIFYFLNLPYSLYSLHITITFFYVCLLFSSQLKKIKNTFILRNL